MKEEENKVIEIMVDSASRPDLLRRTVESMRERIRFSGQLRWLFHEAVLDAKLSIECVEYVTGLNMFDLIEVDPKPRGEGVSITKILKMCESKYFIHWEDDFLAVRDIDLDIPYYIFENTTDVNQIIFNRRDTGPSSGTFFKKEVWRVGHMLTTSPHWRYTPAVWRLSWIMHRWIEYPGNLSHWQINHQLQQKVPDMNEGLGKKDAQWVIDNMGTYYIGPIDEKQYVQHIGKGRSGREK